MALWMLDQNYSSMWYQGVCVICECFKFDLIPGINPFKKCSTGIILQEKNQFLWLIYFLFKSLLFSIKSKRSYRNSSVCFKYDSFYNEYFRGNSRLNSHARIFLSRLTPISY